MSTLDVVAKVLREVAPRALSARQVVELAAGRLPTASRTPETVVSRDLALEVKRNGASSRLLRAAPGEFLLKEALPTAFYNDVEPYAAQWSRNPIAAGEIAAGVVDERSIRDLKPADVASYRQFHAFAGIGVWSRALRDAGWPDDANVWSGSCPCQPWSSAGRRKGHEDERDLWPEWFRLIKACRPAVIIGEQVSSKDSLRWFDGGPNLQRMRDREAVIGVLQGIERQGWAESAVQDVLSTRAKGSESVNEGISRKGAQAVAETESRRSSAVYGALSGKAEKASVLNNARRHRSEAQEGFLRADGNSLQSKGREVLGQPFGGQDRFIEGIYEGQCARCTVLRECDGECLGGGQDRGDCECDREASEGNGRRVPDGATFWGGFGEELEKKGLETVFNSVQADLESIGYAVRAIDTPACGVGAPHRRQRLYWVAYARDRRRALLSASWLHDQGQRGDDASGRGQTNGRVSCAVSDAAGARPQGAQDARADRGDATARAEASQWRSAWDLEPQRDGDADGAGAIPDAERVVWHEGRAYRAHGRAPIEPDGHGKAHGAERDGGWPRELGDAGSNGAGEHCGELPGDEAQHEERSAQGDHASVSASPAHHPGDRVRIVGDPTWGGAVGGFWARDVEWIYCRPTPGHEDGCFRPAESGTFPLANGPSADMGRTRAARLRCFGNAIVLPQATAFVASVIESFVEAAHSADAAAAKAGA